MNRLGVVNFPSLSLDPSFLAPSRQLAPPVLHRRDSSCRQGFNLAGTTSGFDFLSDHSLCCGVTFGLDLSQDALIRVIEAITDGTLIIPLLEIDGNSKVALLELKFPGIVDDWAVAVQAHFVFAGAELASFYLRLCHSAHGSE